VAHAPSSRSLRFPRLDFDITAVGQLERRQEHETQSVRRWAPVGRQEPVVADQRGCDRLHLEHRVLDTDAVPGSGAERDVRVRMSLVTGFRQEVVRIKRVRSAGCAAVVLRTRLQEQRTDDQRGTYKDCTSVSDILILHYALLTYFSYTPRLCTTRFPQKFKKTIQFWLKKYFNGIKGE